MKLADCVEYLSRGKSPNYVDRSEITVINQACIYWDGINSSKVKYHNPNSAYEKAVLQNGDVLINSTGTGTLGRAAVYYDFDEITIADSHVTIIRTDKNKVLPEFLCLYLRHESTQKELYSKCVSGSTNQIELSKEKLLSFPMPEISVEVQHDIVRRLGKISRIITIRNKELSTLDDLIKARFVELMQKSNLSDETTIESITERVKVGFVGTCEKYYTNESGIPMLRTGNITEKGIDLSDLKYVTKEFHNQNKKSQIHSGDLLIARHGSNGQANVYLGPDAQCLNAVVIVPDQSIASSVFLAGLINSPVVKKQIERTLVGSTQHVVNTKSIAGLTVKIPNKSVQEEYESFVMLIDKSKSVIQKSLDETQLLFDSLMQEYFG